jgi:hypothetical protein
MVLIMSLLALQQLIDVYQRDDTKICLFTGAGSSYTDAKQYCVPGGWWGILREIYKGIQREYHPEKRNKQICSEFDSLKGQYTYEWDTANALETMIVANRDRSDNKREFIDFVRDAVIPFRSRAKKHKSKNLPNAYLKDARTLNAILAFCSKLSALQQYPCLELNDKVEAILTLNYDWFLEGGASQKSRRDMFKPMARESSELEDGKLPVYHIHGYFPFSRDEKPDCEIILTKTAYARAYEDISKDSLKNRILNRFLCHFHTLFIGISFNDSYFLEHLKALAKSKKGIPQHFAFFKRNSINDELEQQLYDANVRLIDYSDHKEIPDLLKQVYLSDPHFAGNIRVEDRLKTSDKPFVMLTPHQYWCKLLLIKQYEPSGYEEECSQ